MTTISPTGIRIYEPGIGSEGNHLDVHPYVMEGSNASHGIPTARLLIAPPDKADPASFPSAEVHIRVEDIPALITALRSIADLSPEDWRHLWI